MIRAQCRFSLLLVGLDRTQFFFGRLLYRIGDGQAHPLSQLANNLLSLTAFDVESHTLLPIFLCQEDRKKERHHQVCGVLGGEERGGCLHSGAVAASTAAMRGETLNCLLIAMPSGTRPAGRSPRSARSCWIQWPAPSRMCLPRRPGSVFGKASICACAAGKRSTPSRLPAMNSAGWRIGWPRHGPASSQVRSQVAVPVQPAAEAGARELAGVVVEVGLAAATAAGSRRIDGVVEQPAARRQHGEALALLAQLAAGRVVDAAQAVAHVLLQLGLGARRASGSTGCRRS